MNDLVGVSELADASSGIEFGAGHHEDHLDLIDTNASMSGLSPRFFKSDTLDFPWSFHADAKDMLDFSGASPRRGELNSSFQSPDTNADVDRVCDVFAALSPRNDESGVFGDSISITTNAQNTNDIFWIPCREEKYIEESLEPDPAVFRSRDALRIPAPGDRVRTTRAMSTPALSSISEPSSQTEVDEFRLHPTLSSRQSCGALTTVERDPEPSNLEAHSSVAEGVLRQNVTRGADGLFPCGLCDMRFKQTGNRKKHIEEFHLRMKPYTCKVCNVSFSRKHARDTHHRAVHEKLRPHKCMYCNKQYKNRSDLNKHVRTVEMRQRPFACETCGRCFGERGKLKRHMSVHRKTSEIRG